MHRRFGDSYLFAVVASSHVPTFHLKLLVGRVCRASVAGLKETLSSGLGLKEIPDNRNSPEWHPSSAGDLLRLSSLTTLWSQHCPTAHTPDIVHTIHALGTIQFSAFCPCGHILPFPLFPIYHCSPIPWFLNFWASWVSIPVDLSRNFMGHTVLCQRKKLEYEFKNILS